MQEIAELLGKGLNHEISGSVNKSTSDGKHGMKRKEPPKQYKVHSLERGLDLIELMAEGSPEKSLTELSQLADFKLCMAAD